MAEQTRQHKPERQIIPASKPKTLPSTVHHATASGGQTLDAKTQQTLGPRFGHDFSQVRIHADSHAAESAQALGANAYAVGSDIVFGEGKYAPGTSDTERLLAHELTHVVQQARYGAGDPSRPSQRGDASEREADSVAAQVMMGRSVQVQAMPDAAVARDPSDKPFWNPSDKPSWNPSDKPRWDPNEDLFTRDNTGSWMDKLFGLDRTKSFQESWLDGLLGPESPAHIKEGDSDLTKLGRAGYSVGAGMVAGVGVPAADLLDTLAYGPFGVMESQIKQEPTEAHE